jgi:hypothetical protein
VNRDLVVQHHSIQARAHEWAEVFGAFANHTARIKTGTIPFTAL